MIFYYTHHIRKRIAQRKLTLEMIEKTVTDPDKTQATFKGRYLAQKNFRGKILEVVVRNEGMRLILITAYWLKQKGQT